MHARAWTLCTHINVTGKEWSRSFVSHLSDSIFQALTAFLRFTHSRTPTVYLFIFFVIHNPNSWLVFEGHWQVSDGLFALCSLFSFGSGIIPIRRFLEFCFGWFGGWWFPVTQSITVSAVAEHFSCWHRLLLGLQSPQSLVFHSVGTARLLLSSSCNSAKYYIHLQPWSLRISRVSQY